MASSKITFCCPKCSVKLSIAGEQAGLSGPCPKCGKVIRAPHIQEELSLDDSADAVVKTETSGLPVAPPSNTRTQTRFPKVIGRLDKNQKIAVNELLTGEVEESQMDEEDSLDRGLPYQPIDIETKEELEPIDPPEEVQVEIPAHPKRASGFSLSAVPKAWILGVALALCAVVLLVLQFSQFINGPDIQVEGVTIVKSLDDDSDEVDDSLAIVKIPNIASDPPMEAPNITSDPPVEDLSNVVDEDRITSDEKLKAELIEMAPEELLSRFLEAKSLGERLPLLLSRSSPQDLQETCLAEIFPPVVSMSLEFREHQQLIGVVDSYYLTRFGSSEVANGDFLILVRDRDGVGPRVVVDPFLDTYGNRIRKFSNRPHRGSQTFEAVVQVSATCKNTAVPNYDGKRTLQLRVKEYGAVIAEAYFNKSSEIETMLTDGSYRLSYGNPVVANVTLRWNYSEDKARPFLEAVKVNAFRWGP